MTGTKGAFSGVKSKQSAKSSALSSRWPSEPRLKLCSIKVMNPMASWTVWETYPCLAHGEANNSGTRKP